MPNNRARLLLAQCQHQHGCLLGAGEAGYHRRGVRMAQVTLLHHPTAHDGQAFFRMLVHQLSDVAQRRGLDRALDAAKAHHALVARTTIRTRERQGAVAAGRHCHRAAAGASQGQARGRSRGGAAIRQQGRIGGQAHDHRPQHEQQSQQGDDRQQTGLPQLHQVALVDREAKQSRLRRLDLRIGIGEAQTDHFDLVAALLVEPHGAAGECANALQLVRSTILPGGVAVGALDGDLVHHDRQADPVDQWLIANDGARGLADLVVRRLLGALFLASGRIGAGVGIGQVVGDADVAGCAFRGLVRRIVVLRRPLHLAVGIEFFLGFAHLVVIHLDRRFDPHPAQAQAAFQHVLHRAGQPLFGRNAKFRRRTAALAGHRVPGAGQQVAAAVDDADILRPQARHRRGHQVQDRLHALPVHALGAGHGQHDARLRLLTVTGERFALGQYQVDARRTHAGNHPDGANQLALHRTGLADGLLELARGQAIATVEDFVADGAAGRQALLRQQQPRPRHVGGGNRNPAAIRSDLVRDVRLVQLIDDLGGFARVHVGVEQGHVVAAAAAHGQEGQNQQHGPCDRCHCDQSADAERLEPFQQCCHANEPTCPDDVLPPSETGPAWVTVGLTARQKLPGGASCRCWSCYWSCWRSIQRTGLR